jgi:hypothetical protein
MFETDETIDACFDRLRSVSLTFSTTSPNRTRCQPVRSNNGSFAQTGLTRRPPRSSGSNAASDSAVDVDASGSDFAVDALLFTCCRPRSH